MQHSTSSDSSLDAKNNEKTSGCYFCAVFHPYPTLPQQPPINQDNNMIIRDIFRSAKKKPREHGRPSPNVALALHNAAPVGTQLICDSYTSFLQHMAMSGGTPVCRRDVRGRVGSSSKNRGLRRGPLRRGQSGYWRPYRFIFR